MELLKIIFLFMIAWQLPVIVARIIRGLAVSAFWFIVLAIGITGFTYLMWLI